MVVDKLENLMQYQSLHPRFPKAFAFLRDLLEKGAENGRHELDREVYVNLLTEDTKVKDAAVAESHRKYIDVQLVIEGKEMMCIPTQTPEVSVEYKDEKDCMFYSPVAPGDCYQLRMEAGSFAIFFAGELHAPMMAVNGEAETVRKAVLKVLA